MLEISRPEVIDRFFAPMAQMSWVLSNSAVAHLQLFLGVAFEQSLKVLQK